MHDPRQSALLTSERNVHLYLLYPYSDSYSILFQSFPLFLESFCFKNCPVLPQCRPPKYFTIVSDYDLRPLHAQIRSFSVFLIPKAGRGSVACPRHLPCGSRNRSWTWVVCRKYKFGDIHTKFNYLCRFLLLGSTVAQKSTVLSRTLSATFKIGGR